MGGLRWSSFRRPILREDAGSPVIPHKPRHKRKPRNATGDRVFAQGELLNKKRRFAAALFNSEQM
jgi:hypothetical protein